MAQHAGSIGTVTPVDEQRDRLIAIFGHELRNHLAPLKNVAQLLDGGTAESAAVGRLLSRQVAGMTRLVDDLIEVQRLRSDRLPVIRRRVALAQIVESAIAVTQSTVNEGGHRLEVSIPDEPTYLNADPLWLCQVLQNLIHNASKCTHRGGRVALHAACDGDEVLITVSDTGRGISADELESLFQAYRRGRQASPHVGGLGIGLYLVRLVVEMHGGTIHACSAGMNGGSQFTVRLPRIG